jgi:hypothetical protein
LSKRLLTRLSLHMIEVVLIVLILCLGIRESKATNTVASPDIKTSNVVGIEGNSSTLMNYTYVIEDWRREVKIDAWGGISVADQYSVTNNASEDMYTVSFILPANASAISVQDPFGTYGQTAITNYGTYVNVLVYPSETVSPQQTIRLLVTYSLPSSIYISQRSWQDYTLNINLNKTADWFVKQLTVVVFLPEGAEYQRASETPSEPVQKSGFLESVEFLEVNVTQISEPTITLQYQYFILWAAFRPALWTGTAILIFVALFLTRRVSKPSAAVVAAASLSPSLLRDFVNRYEDKRRLRSELETMEDQIGKGKLSRRRYRLRKSSIDDHLLRLEKNLSELRKQIAAASGQYSERMRHLETADAEIETLKKDMERAKARLLRREITTEAYRKLLDEYSRMKERAENTIEETLLRLREDFR